jgi:hypothetical protein
MKTDLNLFISACIGGVIGYAIASVMLPIIYLVGLIFKFVISSLIDIAVFIFKKLS